MTAIKQDESDIAKASKYLDEWFSDPELESLAFDMSVPYENLPGKTKRRKAQEMVGWMRRHGRLYELVETCREKRPHVPWPFLVDVIED